MSPLIHPANGDPGLKGKRVLVTGGRGFIGSALCRRLEDTGAKVYTVSRTPPRDQSGDLDLVGDLTSIDETRKIFRNVQPNHVFHLASHVVGIRSPDVVLSTYHNNLTSTLNVLVAAHGNHCERVILTGSLEEPMPSHDWPVPSSPYAASKLAAGAYGRMFYALFGLSIVILRVFMVYGPGQRDEKKLVPYVITSLLRGEKPSLMSGQRAVDWVYVDDVVEAFMHAATASGADGATLDVGTGNLVSVRDVVERLFVLLKSSSLPEFGGIPDRPMEQTCRADVAKTGALIHWAPKVPLDEGLQFTIDWYRNRVHKADS